MLAQDHSRLDGIDVRYVMSHLVSAEIADDPMNVLQRDRFVAGRALLPPAPASSSRIPPEFFLDSGFDLARPGAALHGSQSHAWSDQSGCGLW